MNKMEQTKAAYREGKIDADRNGYITSADGGLTFKAPERSKVYASAGRGSRRQPGESVLAPATGTAKEQWSEAIASATARYGSRAKAVAHVAKARPSLRAALIKEANAGNAPRAHRGQTPVARRQPGHRTAPRAMRGQTNAGGMSKMDFTQRVETLMQRDGMSKMEAARQLSREMGLSQQRDGGSYFEQGRERYR